MSGRWRSERRRMTELFRHFDLIATSSTIGRLRPDLGEGVRGLPVLEHIVFYEIYKNRCHILRVLHHRRDSSAAFS